MIEDTSKIALGGEVLVSSEFYGTHGFFFLTVASRRSRSQARALSVAVGSQALALSVAAGSPLHEALALSIAAGS